MAVIGARPASPWFLGRRGRPRPRTRPQPARRGRGSAVVRRVERRVDVRPILVAIVVAAALAFFYLSQSTRVAATGYEIEALEARLAATRAEQQQLIWAIGQARSPAEITKRAQRQLRLVPIEQGAVTYATVPDADSD
jgi:cell division protein FtsB